MAKKIAAEALVEPASDAPGDRHSEAKAHIETESGAVPDDKDVERVERRVRRRHGDISPSKPPTRSRR